MSAAISTADVRNRFDRRHRPRLPQAPEHEQREHKQRDDAEREPLDRNRQLHAVRDDDDRERLARDRAQAQPRERPCELACIVGKPERWRLAAFIGIGEEKIEPQRTQRTRRKENRKSLAFLRVPSVLCGSIFRFSDARHIRTERSRQLDRDFEPAAVGVLRADMPAVTLDRGARDRETEPGCRRSNACVRSRCGRTGSKMRASSSAGTPGPWSRTLMSAPSACADRARGARSRWCRPACTRARCESRFSNAL